MDTAASIREYIRTDLLSGGDPPLTDDTPLWGGLLDSVALMELVAFLEERYRVEISDEELTSAELGTVASIARLVDRKVGEA